MDAQGTPSSRARFFGELIAGDTFKKAVDALERNHDRLVEELVTLTEIPAPPFGEAARAKAYADMLSALGLDSVEIDDEGNVTALRRGTDGTAPKIVVNAHLDTVFPAGTDVAVRREGTTLRAPGIGDNTRGLATILAYLRALDAANAETANDILVVATVGEEGQGDLRGMRHFFTAGKYRDQVGAVICVDGPFPRQRIITGGTGSRRFRVTFRGPGGHSFGDAGIVNPMYAAAHAMTELGRIPLSDDPKTTCNPTVIRGGTSVNAIPETVEMLVDLRSNDAGNLDALAAAFAKIIPEACRAENAARSTEKGEITADVEGIGDRPVGSTPADSDLVAFARLAVEATGETPVTGFSSTDANIPMSVDVPAITLTSGAEGGGAHTLAEWISVEPTNSVRAMTIGLSTLMAMAGARIG